jgi:hypothetical protein
LYIPALTIIGYWWFYDSSLSRITCRKRLEWYGEEWIDYAKVLIENLIDARVICGAGADALCSTSVSQRLGKAREASLGRSNMPVHA